MTMAKMPNTPAKPTVSTNMVVTQPSTKRWPKNTASVYTSSSKASAIMPEATPKLSLKPALVYSTRLSAARVMSPVRRAMTPSKVRVAWARPLAA